MTALNRRSRGMATGSEATSSVTAPFNISSRKAAASRLKRSSSPWGLISTPRLAATWASSAMLASGFFSQPSTVVWANTGPVSSEARLTNPVGLAKASAMVVNTVRIASATFGIVAMEMLLLPLGQFLRRNPRGASSCHALA